MGSGQDDDVGKRGTYVCPQPHQNYKLQIYYRTTIIQKFVRSS